KTSTRQWSSFCSSRTGRCTGVGSWPWTIHSVLLRSGKPHTDMRLRNCLVVALLIALAGCAEPLPRLSPPVTAQWQHAAASTQAKPSALHSWWHAFADPELDALVDRAL